MIRFNGINPLMLVAHALGGLLTGSLGALWVTDYIAWPKELTIYHYLLMTAMGIIGAFFFALYYYVTHRKD